MNDQSRNILTVEDPIEYAVDGIGQTQVNNKVGMTFAAGLRAILRQDPDVVMVGEIRDKETAEIAIQASLTGHLVLSTIHTNDTLGAITRLIDMGVEPYLLASSLRTIISQRLVRKLSSDGETYSGRQGIFEIFKVDDEVRHLINENLSTPQLRRRARELAARAPGEQLVDLPDLLEERAPPLLSLRHPPGSWFLRLVPASPRWTAAGVGGRRCGTGARLGPGGRGSKLRAGGRGAWFERWHGAAATLAAGVTAAVDGTQCDRDEGGSPLRAVGCCTQRRKMHFA